MSELMKSVSGIRGVFGEGLNPEIVMKYAGLFGSRRSEVGSRNGYQRTKIVVGRDSRTTGDALVHAAIAGLLSVGVDVIWIGIVATPTLLLSVKELGAQGGICVTASHNPAEWNALKLVDANGMFLFPEVMSVYLSMLDDSIEYVKWDEMGVKYEDFDASWRHIKKILSIEYLDVEKVRGKRFKVVLDSVNGAGGVISPTLLRELGCEVVEINSEPTGYFAHEPEPLAKNLGQICDEVRKHKADIGFATDPDVDRLVIIDEKGECVGEEFSLLLAEKFVLRQKTILSLREPSSLSLREPSPLSLQGSEATKQSSKYIGDIVTNLSSSMASEDIAREFGVKVIRTKVGEINVGKTMMEIGSPIGGEGNGGIICPEVNYTRDAVVGMALVLSYMAERGLTISDLVSEIPRYYFAKDAITASTIGEGLNNDHVMQKALTIYPEAKKDTTDGVKIIFDKAWIHIRKSGTEPIIRVYVEAGSEQKAQELCKETINKLMG